MKRSEREAAEKAAQLLKRLGSTHARDGDAKDEGQYGTGGLTKHQKKSQEKHIPMTERDNSRGAKVRRALWG